MQFSTRFISVLCCAISLVGSFSSAFAESEVKKFEVSFPTQMSNQQFGNTKLVLNGIGLRKKLVFKVYAGALYLQEKSSSPEIIMESKTPKYVLMHFLRDVDSEAIQKALSEGFQKGCGATCASYESDNSALSKTIAALGAFKKGNELGFSLLSEGTVGVYFNNQLSGTVGSREFSKLFLKIFLGENPPSEDLKQGMLGK
jgi:Chalcone isomerase-like